MARLCALALCALSCVAFQATPRRSLRRARPLRAGDDESIDDEAEAARIAAFRARLVSGGLDAVASVAAAVEGDEGPSEWARAAAKPAAGVVLVGSESYFFADDPGREAKASLARVGLPEDAADRIPPERQAALAPVVLLLDASKRAGFTGVLMGRRSGYMMGDFSELSVENFRLQPLWIGGPHRDEADGRRTVGAASDEATTTGIVAVHPYRTVVGAEPLNDDGLFVGGAWSSATMLAGKGMANPFRFRLFAQATTWRPGDLEREINAGAWSVLSVSTDLLLKDRDRGARPLALDILDAVDAGATN